MSPVCTSRSIPSTARTRPKRFTSPRVVITAVTRNRLTAGRRGGEGVEGDRAREQDRNRARAARPASARPDRRPAGFRPRRGPRRDSAPGRSASRGPDPAAPARPPAGSPPGRTGRWWGNPVDVQPRQAGELSRQGHGIDPPAGLENDLGVARLADARSFRRGEAVMAADGRPTSKSRNRVSSAGRSIPFSYTCTCRAGHWRGPPRRRPGRRTTPPRSGPGAAPGRRGRTPCGRRSGPVRRRWPRTAAVGPAGGQQVRRRGQRERRGLGAGGGGALVLPGPGAALVVVGAGLAGRR